jgi:glycerol uptake facilitator-like aquaporin
MSHLPLICKPTPAGGHLNPAITMGCLCTKKVTAQRAVCYWVAQVLQLLWWAVAQVASAAACCSAVL